MVTGRLRFGSVCSGIEAASVAWNPLGWEAQWFSEIEPFPCAVLAHHYKDTPNLGDMTRIHETNEFSDRPIDLLVGGTPCQSFSVAGLREGLADPRGNLALVFLSILGRKRPRWVVWENVPGVLSSWSDVPNSFAPEGDPIESELTGKPGRERGLQSNDFDTFTSGLRELGYRGCWRILDAQYFGVPQRRRRVFVVGYLGDWRPPFAVLFERHSMFWNPAPCRKAGEGIAPPVAGCSNGGGGNGPGRSADDAESLIIGTLNASAAGMSRPVGQGNELDFCVPVAGTVSKKWAKGTGGPAGDECQNLVTIPLQEVGARESKNQNGVGIGIGDHGDVMYTLQAGQTHGIAYGESVHTTGHQGDRVVGDGDVHPALSAQGGNNGGGAGALVFESRFARNGRGAPEEVCPPLKAQSGETGKGGASPLVAGTGMQVRRLTPRECERLQGFPDDYTLITYRGKPASDGPRYKAIGNSMAIPCMAWIGKRIAQVDAIITSAKVKA